MQNLRKEKVRAELQLQRIRYERQSECLKQIDNKMTNLIKSNFNEKIPIILQYQWTKYCQIGDASKNLNPCKNFQRKNHGLKKTEFQRVNHNTAVSETLINNIQYRTYYRNDYNQDKKNRRNSYRSNIGHGGE